MLADKNNVKQLNHSKQSDVTFNETIQELQQANCEYMRCLSAGLHHEALDLSSKIKHLITQLNLSSTMRHLAKLEAAQHYPHSSVARQLPRQPTSLFTEEQQKALDNQYFGKVG